MKYDIYILAMSNIHINRRLFVQSNSYSFWQHYPACFHGSPRDFTPLCWSKNPGTIGLLGSY